MAGVQPRQLLAWSLPALALICSYLWLRRRRHFPGKPDKKDQSSSNGSIKSGHRETEDLSSEIPGGGGENHKSTIRSINNCEINDSSPEKWTESRSNLSSETDEEIIENGCTQNHTKDSKKSNSDSEILLNQENSVKAEKQVLNTASPSGLRSEEQSCNLSTHEDNRQAETCTEVNNLKDCSCTAALADSPICAPEEENSQTCSSVENKQSKTTPLQRVDSCTESHLPNISAELLASEVADKISSAEDGSCTQCSVEVEQYSDNCKPQLRRADSCTESQSTESSAPESTDEDSHCVERSSLRPQFTSEAVHTEVTEVQHEPSEDRSSNLEVQNKERSLVQLSSSAVESGIASPKSVTTVSSKVDSNAVSSDVTREVISVNESAPEVQFSSSLKVQSQSCEIQRAAEVPGSAAESIQADSSQSQSQEKELTEDCSNCAQVLSEQTVDKSLGVCEEGYLCADSDKGVGDCPNSSVQDQTMAWHCNAGPAGDSSGVQTTQKQTDCPQSSTEDVTMTNGTTERDSANHSPADAMLGSPSISNDSDNHSENSSDSGKGGSDVATTVGCSTLASVFEFLLPQHLVGRLIGRHGCSVQNIRTVTHASVVVKRHPDTPSLKIVAVEGTQEEIDAAIALIRKKFPLKQFPEVTLEQVTFAPVVPAVPIVPDFLQLQLVSGVSNDVILSSLVSAGHFFVQQPTHPTYPSLSALDRCMAMCYSEPTAPPLPLPVQVGVVCAAPALDGWYRAQVVSSDELTDDCEVRFVDYGGYLRLEASALRQIRSDFMLLPFQATECCLANVQPVGEEGWTVDATACVEELTQGHVLQAHVVGYSTEGITFVLLYTTQGPMHQPILVNQELVERGHATWIDQMAAEQ